MRMSDVDKIMMEFQLNRIFLFTARKHLGRSEAPLRCRQMVDTATLKTKLKEINDFLQKEETGRLLYSSNAYDLS